MFVGVYTIEYLDDDVGSTTTDKVFAKSVTSHPKPIVKNVNSDSEERTKEIIQAKKCLEVAKLLMQADQMIKKRICVKTLMTRKK